MVLRQRLKKVVSLKTVKVLDAFPKVDQSCRESSPIGGTRKFLVSSSSFDINFCIQLVIDSCLQSLLALVCLSRQF